VFLHMFICSDGKDGCRIVKDIVCFHAANFQQVTEKLLLDLHEPPMSQVLRLSFLYTKVKHLSIFCFI